MLGLMIVLVGIFLIIGFFKYFFKNGCSFWGIVVEKIIIWSFLGKWVVIWLIVFKKFMFKVILVLLIMNWLVVWIFKVWELIRFKICFGVLIISWGWCWFNCLIWCFLLVLLM